MQGFEPWPLEAARRCCQSRRGISIGTVANVRKKTNGSFRKEGVE